MKLLDDASEALQYNRDLLQTALNHVRQGHCGVRSGSQAHPLEQSRSATS